MMGLVGRLHDLPITDILQIVFLSRGTGLLEVRLPQGRHTVMFRRGLMVNASSPDMPSLRSDLESRLDLAPLNAPSIFGKAEVGDRIASNKAPP